MSDLLLKESRGILDAFKMYRLYHKAFPREEKKPYWLIKNTEHRGYGRNFSIHNEKGEFLGLMFTISNGDFILLDYFAIEQKHRGQGIGTQALRQLKEIFAPLSIILEIEDPELVCDNREERCRRAEFYSKCGMRTLNYRVSLFGVDMCILTSGADVSFDEYHGLLKKVFGEIISKNVYLLG